MADQGPELPKDEVTPEPLFQRRREFLKDALLFTATSVGVGLGLTSLLKGGRAEPPPAPGPAADGPEIEVARGSRFSTDETRTPFRDVTTYNNFYEFGLDKADPSLHAHTLRTRPWTVAIEGLVREPRTLDLDTLQHLVFD